MPAIDLYHRFLDGLIPCRRCLEAEWVAQASIPANTTLNEQVNLTLAQFTPEQRQVVASLVEYAKDIGIQETLNYLTEAMLRDDLRITYHGMEMPVQPYGNPLYADFLERCTAQLPADTLNTPD